MSALALVAIIGLSVASPQADPSAAEILLYGSGENATAEKIDEVRMVEIFSACSFRGVDPVKTFRTRSSAFGQYNAECSGAKAIAKSISVRMDLSGKTRKVSIYLGLVIFMPSPPAATRKKVGALLISEVTNG